MALLDIFKKRKEKPSKDKPVRPANGVPGGKKKKKETLKKAEIAKEEKVEKVSEALRPRIRRGKKLAQSYKVLRIPHITEKATDLTKKNQYIFRVWPESNKIEIKKTIEDVYDVDVLSVKIINVHPKRRRLGRSVGWRKGYKKAIVKIKEGQKIEVLPR